MSNTSTEHYHENKEHYQRLQHKYYMSNRDHIIHRVAEYRKNNPDKIKQWREEYYQKNHKRDYLRHRNQQLQSVEATFIHALDIIANSQTHICSMCGETDLRCLQFDHIHGNGRKHRKSTGIKSITKWIINNPKKAKTLLQILCANCNAIKRYVSYNNES